MKRRVLEILARARAELDEAAHELELEVEESGVAQDQNDLLEVRARVDALEARVAAIEERGPG